MTGTPSRLDRLRSMRDFLDAEIEAELDRLGCLDAERHALIQRVADLYDLDVEDLRGGSRIHRIAQARHGAAWLLRRTGLTFPAIGAALRCDHSSAVYACRRVDADQAMRSMLLGLEGAA